MKKENTWLFNPAHPSGERFVINGAVDDIEKDEHMVLSFSGESVKNGVFEQHETPIMLVVPKEEFSAMALSWCIKAGLISMEANH